ncbi:MAG: PaaI family thioesterase [Oscillospiraceae bacterium]|nr:PaaI family thioesterase [Oscillospiraceae bacterium]
MRLKVTKKQNCARRCLVCGLENALGLRAQYYELEDGTLAGLVTARSEHQSYPGRVHGGVITALLDETIGRAVNIAEPDTWAVTAEISVRFKKPVPYGVPLLVVGRVTDNNRRLFSGTGELLLPDGCVAASATARYRKLKLADIADFAAAGDDWAVHPSPADPAEIEIPDSVCQRK